MSEGFNKVILTGNLGFDPELKTFSNGGSILKLRLAVTERVYKVDKWDKETQWFNISLGGNRTESLSKILKKGMFVLIEGSIRNFSYEKDGQKLNGYEIKATDLKLMESKIENKVEEKIENNSEFINSDFPSV